MALTHLHCDHLFRRGARAPSPSGVARQMNGERGNLVSRLSERSGEPFGTDGSHLSVRWKRDGDQQYALAGAGDRRLRETRTRSAYERLRHVSAPGDAKLTSSQEYVRSKSVRNDQSAEAPPHL